MLEETFQSIHSKIIIHMGQKVRSRWIKEGDCNSRYFHLMINVSRRNNCLKGLMIDGAWIEEPATVKETVRMFFSQRFQESVQDRPRLETSAKIFSTTSTKKSSNQLLHKKK